MSASSATAAREPDARDLVLEQLALDEARLRAHLRSHQELLSLALELLAVRDEQLAHLHERYERLVDEYRRLRAQVCRREAEAA